MLTKIIKFAVRKIPRIYLIRLSYLFSRLIVPFYKGNKVECPICEGKFRKFLPYGNKGWDNRLCPSCLSLERHRLLWIFLKEKTDFFSERFKVLHIAPEQTFLKRFRQMPNLYYTTADLESPIADIKLDVTNMPLPDESYDIVICNHVMEHIEDEGKAVREIYRILKSDGFAIMQVPLDASRNETFEDATITNRKEREEIFGQYDHVRIYGHDYPQRICSHAKFTAEIHDLIGEFSSEKNQRFRLDKTEKIFIFRK